MNNSVYHFITKYVKLRFKYLYLLIKMKIEINPRSLLNLENICEILYKLHPRVLDKLVDMERRLGKILGMNETDNLSFEQRELLTELKSDEDNVQTFYGNDKDDDSNDDFKKIVNFLHGDGDYYEDIFRFNKLLKYLQLDTYEYIPIKISIDVEDPVIGKKVRELVRALEMTKSPEQFYLNKREMDYEAYFAEGYYNDTMTEEQKNKKDDLFSDHNPDKLEKLLIKEKLYEY